MLCFWLISRIFSLSGRTLLSGERERGVFFLHPVKKLLSSITHSPDIHLYLPLNVGSLGRAKKYIPLSI